MQHCKFQSFMPQILDFRSSSCTEKTFTYKYLHSACLQLKMGNILGPRSTGTAGNQNEENSKNDQCDRPSGPDQQRDG